VERTLIGPNRDGQEFMAKAAKSKPVVDFATCPNVPKDMGILANPTTPFFAGTQI